MKVQCISCGCHFIHDFELTFQPKCNFWGDCGMANVPIEYKRKFWDWLFSMPADEIVQFGLDIGFKYRAQPIRQGNRFEDLVANWSELTEEERQDFQRKFFSGELKALKGSNG